MKTWTNRPAIVPALLAVALAQGCSCGGSEAETPQGPQLRAALARSLHYVEVEFTEAPAAAATRPECFWILGPDGEVLGVRGTGPGSAPRRLFVATEAQREVLYQLRYNPEPDAAVWLNGAAPVKGSPTQTATFQGSNEPEPYLQTAIALTPTRVLLTFSHALASSATTVEWYRIVAPGGTPTQDVGDLDIVAAELSADGTQVVLTTEEQSDLEYTVIVTNVRRKVDTKLIDPTRNTATFFGRTPIDTVAPRVAGAVAVDATTVIVSFSEPLSEESADPLHFTLSPFVPVTFAELSAWGTQVVLRTLPLAAGVTYTVTVSDVTDLQDNPIDPDHDSATFLFEGQAGLDSSELPRLVGAASTGNTGVVVQFNRPMGASAENPGAYVIVQANVNPEVGTLLVTAAAFAGPDRTTVRLTTQSQNELTYLVTVVGVADLIGQPIAPRQIVDGVLVEAATWTFPGTPAACAPMHCANSHGGVGGTGLCASDDDCTDTPPCGTTPECFQACVDPCQLRDGDGDGLADNEEQRGWLVTGKSQSGVEFTRQVTSDIGVEDTDRDGLPDALERALFTDPRDPDTDDDQISDDEEYNVVYSDPLLGDSDGDGISEGLEIEFFRTNAILADSDGDGWSDGQELFELHRDPRLADVPEWLVTPGNLRLQLDERFTWVDETGATRSSNNSTATHVTRTDESNMTRSASNVLKFMVSGDGGISDQNDGGWKDRLFIRGHAEFGGEFTWGFSNESKSSVQTAFDTSITAAQDASSRHGVTRDIAGARIDVEVMLENPGDTAFSLENVELTVLAADPQDRTKLVPVATLVPATELLTGQPAVFNLGPYAPGRGPIVFTNREIYPAMVRDLLDNPRPLVFRVVNYDLKTADGRDFSLGSQVVQDRTAGIVIDFGDGTVRRFQAIVPAVLTHARDELRCGPSGDHPGAECLSDADCGTSAPCATGTIIGGFSGYPGTGRQLGVPVDFLLTQTLGMTKSTPAVVRAGTDGDADTTASGDDVQVITAGTADLAPGAIVVSPGRNGVLDTAAATGDVRDGAVPDGILVGPDRSVQSIAAGDDIQLIPVGTDGVPEDAIVIAAGADGVLDTTPRGDDKVEAVTGYETSLVCNADTETKLLPGANATLDTTADGDDVVSGSEILPGPNGFVDSVPRGDDLVVGPGFPCVSDLECTAGLCNGPENVVRIENRRRGQYRRQWTLLLPDDSQLQTDFGFIRVRPGDTLRLAFVQDIDRDGLIAQEEFVHGSSDQNQDTDSDGLDDFVEVRVGWTVGVVGQALRQVFPDPSLADTDGDGLSDLEESDLHALFAEAGLTAGHYGELPDFPYATDPGRTDTDEDRLADGDELFGVLTGGGLLDTADVVLAGTDRVADTLACGRSCVAGTRSGKSCRRDRDCPESTCSAGPAGCDDIQIVEVGTRGLDPRTVVVAPGADDILSTTAHASDLDPATADGLSSSTAVGDDLPVAGPGDPVRDTDLLCFDRSGFTLCSVVKPGLDGALQSVPGGDDVAARGQRLEHTDPLNPDTDADDVGDGVETARGSSPTNPDDTGVFADRDLDGLSDNQEQLLGWTIAVTPAGGSTVTRHVYSNPNTPDSDQDGLPDLVERLRLTDPTRRDTDGDGLSDYDEITADDLETFGFYADVFRGFHLDETRSKKYGTNPLRGDTDLDTLADNFELLVGWSVRLPGQSVARGVFSDPLRSDTDYDGLQDDAESRSLVTDGPTDPTDPDTDDDGRLDGQECGSTTCSSHPLVPDRLVTVSYYVLELILGGDDGLNALTDLGWTFRVQKPGEAFPGTPVITTNTVGIPTTQRFTQSDCEGQGGRWTLCESGHCSIKSSNVLEMPAGRRTVTFPLRDGQGFVLSGEVNEYDDCPRNVCQGGPYNGRVCSQSSDCSIHYCVGGTNPGVVCFNPSDCEGGGWCQLYTYPCAPESFFRHCHMSFFEAFSYSSLPGGFSTERYDMTAPNSRDFNDTCHIIVTAEVTVE